MPEEKTTKINEDKKDYGEVFFQWSFPDFPHYERSASWYWWTGLWVVVLLIFSIVSRNFLFAIIVILSTLIIILFRRNVNQINFKITEDGILVNNKLYEYKVIKNFYIFYQPPEVKTLYFELKGFFSPRIPAALEDQNPVTIREVLLRYIPEDLEREHEPVSDQFHRFFKL